MSLDWDSVLAFGLTLPGAILSTSYGKPAAKVNDRAFLSPGREDGSFCLHIDMDRIEILKETDPDTYWQSSHYEGWPAVLVRYDSDDPDRVFDMIREARDWNAARPKPKPRKKA